MRYLILCAWLSIFFVGKSNNMQEFLEKYKIFDIYKIDGQFTMKEQKICSYNNSLKKGKIVGVIGKKIYYSCISNEEYRIYSIEDFFIEEVLALKKNREEEVKNVKLTENFIIYERKFKDKTNGKKMMSQIEKFNIITKEKEVIKNSSIILFKNNTKGSIYYYVPISGDIYKENMSTNEKLLFNLTTDEIYGIEYLDNDIAIGSLAEKLYNNDDLRTEIKNIYQYDKNGNSTLLYKSDFDIATLYVTDDKKYMFIGKTEIKEEFFKKQNVKRKLYIMNLEKKEIEEIKDEEFISIYNNNGAKLFPIKK